MPLVGEDTDCRLLCAFRGHALVHRHTGMSVWFCVRFWCPCDGDMYGSIQHAKRTGVAMAERFGGRVEEFAVSLQHG